VTTYSTSWQTRTPGLCEPVTAKPADRAPTDASRFDAHEGMRVRNASRLAAMLLPGPLGKLVERELLDYANFGYRLDQGGLVMSVVRQLEQMPTEAAERAS
jgi:hypothetical protein